MKINGNLVYEHLRVFKFENRCSELDASTSHSDILFFPANMWAFLSRGRVPPG
jgi:hypothetical protein